MLDKLITRSFKTRDASHLAHWATKSYAQHEALGDLYDDIISATDKLVEAHQGLFGLVKTEAKSGEEVVKLLKSDIIWLTENREEITRGVPALGNLLDELTEVYLKALYKLQNLR